MYAVTGRRRVWKIFMIAETSAVEEGKTIRNGRSDVEIGCVDHELPECVVRSSGAVETFSLPTMATRSAQAAWRFVGAVLCSRGGEAARGVVEVAGRGEGLSVPK